MDAARDGELSLSLPGAPPAQCWVDQVSNDMNDTLRTAACSCGAVSVAVKGAPLFQAVCACRECQTRTGSAFGMSVYYPADQVVGKTGAPTTYRRMSNKQRWLDFRFCPVCGVTVWWEAEFMPGKIGVAGILFADRAFAPDGAYFCATKPSWVAFDADVPQGQGPTTGS